MQIGDDLSPEEEAMYLGGYYSTQPQSRQNDGDDYIDQYQQKSSRPSSYMLQEEEPHFRAPKRKASYMLGDEEDAANDLEEVDLDDQQYSGVVKQVTGDDKEIEEHPIMRQYEFLVPVNRMGAGRPIVPRHIQDAALQLLDAASIQGGSLIRLDGAARKALMPCTNQIDEYASVDPAVVISCSLPISDSFRSFLEEIISFSEYILLRVLNASFRVIVTSSVKTKSIPFNDPDLGLKVRPYAGEDDARGQPFNVRDAILSAGQHLEKDRWLQIEAHMLSLGKLSPTSVCDDQFIEDQMEVFKEIISGKTRIVKKRQRKDGTK